MVNRRKQKRVRAKRAADSHSSNTGVVTHHQVPVFPRYHWLLEHGQRVTVIRLPNLNAVQEVDEMMRRAKAVCKHKDKLGECISLELATIDDWLTTHPGT